MTAEAQPGVVYRDAVHDMYVRPADRLGRQQPRVIGPLTYLQVIPGLAAQWKPIPAEYWTTDAGEGGVTFAVVSCPCGETPRVEIGLLDSCACERLFWFADSAVLVANSPRVEPPTPAAS